MGEDIEKERAMENEKMRRPHVLISFGTGGHEDEYIILNRPHGFHGTGADIPIDWLGVFERQLGKEWYIMDRGPRLEIKPPIAGKNKLIGIHTRTEQTDSSIREILKSLVGEDCEIKFI